MSNRARQWLLVLSVLSLSACSTPDTTQAAQMVGRFHAAYNGGRIDLLAGMTSPAFRAAGGPGAFERMMDKVRAKLGKVRIAKQVNWRVNVGTGGATTLLQDDTVFERGKARESFVFVEDHGHPALNAYNINSPDLL